MPPRRKKKRTRRRSSFSFLNALEAYTYATIMTQGITGSSPIGFLMGDADLGMTAGTASGRPIYTGQEAEGLQVVGAGEISLGDIITEPSMAMPILSANLQQNMLPMALAGMTTAFTFRIGKRLLRKQISSVNRHIIKPVLGAGIRL